MRSAVFLVSVAACGPRAISPGTPEQTVAVAMRLVCDAPARARADHGDGTRSDKIAGHLTDGIGNVEVLTTVEAWKTDGIKLTELDALVDKAKLAACPLRAEAP